MKKTILSFSFAAATILGATANVPADFYQSLEGKSGVELKKAVKDLAVEHVEISYGSPNPGNTFHPVYVASWSVFEESDVRMVDGHLCWWDMYSPYNIWVADGHPGLNIEHSVPNSWWGGQSGNKTAYCDLHLLNPSNGDANGAKSNNPLGIIGQTVYFDNGVAKTGAPVSGTGGGASRVFEPHDMYKGDFARAYMYVFTIYDDISWQDGTNYMYDLTSNLMFQPWASDLLLQWNADDPVSQKEVDRNEVIYSYQENRNPFIDCPALADHIWGDKQNVPFHYEIYTPEEEDPADYPGGDEVFAEMHKGQWVPINSADELSEEYSYFIVSPSENKAMACKLIPSNTKAIDVCQFGPLHELKDYPEVLTAVPVDIATVKLEKADGDSWYVGVYDPDQNFCGYISFSKKNTADLVSGKNDYCKAKISVDGANNKTSIVYNLSGEDYTLQYNSGNPRFAGYTSSQKAINLYRASDEVLTDTPPSTGIDAVDVEANAAEEITGIFDLNGRRLNTLSTSDLGKGIYIVVSNFGAKKIVK